MSREPNFFTKQAKNKNQTKKEHNKASHDNFLKRLVTNLSSHNLSHLELTALQKGLKFVPTSAISKENLTKSLHKFIRKMSIHFHFRNNDIETPPLWKPSKWEPPIPKNTNLIRYFKSITNNILQINPNLSDQNAGNLNHDLRGALFSLKNNPGIVIKPADKGGSIVILDKSEYISKIEKLLNNNRYYSLLPKDPTPNIRVEIESYTEYLLRENHISKSTAHFLKPTFPSRTPIFYGLPKIHKPGVPLRPIVSANDSPTENISSFIDYICQPLMKNLPSFIKDTKDFLQQILNLEPLPDNAILVTADVVSLYTNIPQEEGISVLLEHMNQHVNLLPSDCPPPHVIRTLMNFILKDNCFQFLDKYYRQVHGTAMGSKCAPPYSSVYMGNFESTKILPLTKLIKFWKRFIDDIFFIFYGSEKELAELCCKINNLHDSIKFTFSYSYEKIDFLDTTLFIDSDRKIYSTIFTKPTDTFALLHYHSFHPESTKSSIIYSQALRYRMLITKDSMLIKALERLRTVLLFRGYPKYLIELNFEKIIGMKQRDALFRNEPTPTNLSVQTANKNLIFTMPFSHCSNLVKKALLSDWECIAADETLSRIWPSPPIIAHTRHKNLKDILVNTKTTMPA